MTTQTREDLKKKAKLIRNLLREKCGSEISHSQSLELISNMFGFKDWNTASAILPTDKKEKVKDYDIERINNLVAILKDPYIPPGFNITDRELPSFELASRHMSQALTFMIKQGLENLEQIKKDFYFHAGMYSGSHPIEDTGYQEGIFYSKSTFDLNIEEYKGIKNANQH